VSGIGFLGAGAIIRHGISVKGLTTAAGLWTAAAVGMAVGVGMYALSVVTAITVLVSLSVLQFVETRLILPRTRGRLELLIRFRERGFGRLSHLIDMLEARHVRVVSLALEPEDSEQDTVRMVLLLPGSISRGELLAELSDLGEVAEPNGR
jgi:putative Mg2+ transporter-C (MgtC) family protein